MRIAFKGALALNKFLWPLLIYALYLPYIYGQGSLYRLNPELANEFVMPVLLAVQPMLLPFTMIAGAVYAFLYPRPLKLAWPRYALLAGMWAIAIEFLFSLRLEPFAAVAKINP